MQMFSLNDTHEDVIIKYPHTLAPSIRILISKIDEIINRNSENRTAELGELMKTYPVKLKDLKKYAFIEESAPYTRNLIWETDEYALILMCWKPMHDTSIHGHGGSNCWARVVNGEVKECRYSLNEEGIPVLVSETILECGKVTYIDDSIGLHALRNPSNTYPMSLHLYTPPIRTSRYFDVKDMKMVPCEVSYHRVYNSRST